MVHDYSNRKQVNKNRPKNRGIGLLAVAAIGALITVFALGFVSGWFVGKRPRQVAAAPRTEAAPGGKEQGAAASPTGVAGGVEPSLTFYDTLPKGGKAVIGTGLNPPRPGDKVVHTTPEPDPLQTPKPLPSQPAEPIRVPAPAKSADRPEAAEGGVKSGSRGKYAIQIASYRTKRDAEAARDTLVTRGFSAYILESHLKDKGTWYRVRVGKQLDQKQANDLAVKAGAGAIITPE